MIYKTLHRKLTIKHHEPHKNWGWAQMLWKGKKSLKIPKRLSENLNRRTEYIHLISLKTACKIYCQKFLMKL